MAKATTKPAVTERRRAGYVYPCASCGRQLTPEEAVAEAIRYTNMKGSVVYVTKRTGRYFCLDDALNLPLLAAVPQ